MLGHPVMVTLNLRGRLVNALLPTKMRWNSRADGTGVEELLQREPGRGTAMMRGLLSIPV